MNIDDISIDCETLSIKYDAPIISIGAVHFNRTTGKLGATFYEEIAIDSALKSGRPLSTTLQWWLTQDSNVRDIFRTPDTQKQSLATVLHNFSAWCRGVAVGGVPRPWARGPAEDIVWLQHAFEVGGHGLAVPWGHTVVRDVRTIVELAQELVGFEPATVPDVGTAHNGLDDAKYQANLISAAYAALRRSGKKVKPVIDDEL